jgi:ATP-binding cassette subfamily B protein
VLVSHRVSTVKDCDLILVLADGQIAERGTHDELIAQGGLYSEMNRRQQLEAEVSGDAASEDEGATEPVS